MLISDVTLNGIIEEQYYLAKKCGISYSESENMADFERFILVSLLMRDLKEKKKAMGSLKK